MENEPASTVSLEVAGEALELLPAPALFWPARDTLIVSDLHWGKSETFQTAGIPIPDALAEDDLQRLTLALELTRARRLLVLGDLIHGAQGLTTKVKTRIAAWCARFRGEFTVVRGNHDRHGGEVPRSWGIEWVDHLIDGPFSFAHEPEPTANHFTWAGHLHPTFRLATGSDSVRLPCFYIGPRVGILPAFSRFTRGLLMSPEPQTRVFLVADHSVIEVARGVA